MRLAAISPAVLAVTFWLHSAPAAEPPSTNSDVEEITLDDILGQRAARYETSPIREALRRSRAEGGHSPDNKQPNAEEERDDDEAIRKIEGEFGELQGRLNSASNWRWFAAGLCALVMALPLVLAALVRMGGELMRKARWQTNTRRPPGRS